MEVDASDDHLYELLYIIIIYSGLCYLLRFSLLAVCSAGISSEQISAPRDFFQKFAISVTRFLSRNMSGFLPHDSAKRFVLHFSFISDDLHQLR